MPIDFGGHRSSGIAAIAYAKLRRALGLPERPIRVYDPVQQLAIIDDDVLDRFGVDTIELGRGFARGPALGGLGPARRHALPDAGWALPERQPGGWVLRAAAAGCWPGCRTGPCISSSAIGRSWRTDDLDRLPEALAENMWCAVVRRRGRWPRGRTAAGARRGARQLAHGPSGPSWASSAAISWKSASSCTVSTTS